MKVLCKVTHKRRKKKKRKVNQNKNPVYLAIKNPYQRIDPGSHFFQLSVLVEIH